MALKKTVKCAYKHCQHESCDIPRDSAVLVGTRYMHTDCAEKQEYIGKVRDLYYEKVSKTVVMKQLVGAINDLVFKKDVDPRYLYFALDFAITNKFKIKSPYSLHYIIDYSSVKNAWKKKKEIDCIREMKRRQSEQPEEAMKIDTFQYSTGSQKTGFGAILGGN